MRARCSSSLPPSSDSATRKRSWSTSGQMNRCTPSPARRRRLEHARGCTRFPGSAWSIDLGSLRHPWRPASVVIEPYATGVPSGTRSIRCRSSASCLPMGHPPSPRRDRSVALCTDPFTNHYPRSYHRSYPHHSPNAHELTPGRARTVVVPGDPAIVRRPDVDRSRRGGRGGEAGLAGVRGWRGFRRVVAIGSGSPPPTSDFSSCGVIW